MKHPKKILAVYNDSLYINMKYSGLHPLVILSDGLLVSSWQGDPHKYLRMDEVIEWYETEQRQGVLGKTDQGMMDQMKRIYTNFKISVG